MKRNHSHAKGLTLVASIANIVELYLADTLASG
jgi:hypothetical protein